MCCTESVAVPNMLKVIWAVIIASLEKLILFLNQLSSEYREISRQLTKEKEREKMKLKCQASDLCGAI